MQKRHFEKETVTAASYFEDLTLTIGLTPSDFRRQESIRKNVRVHGWILTSG